MSTSLKDVLQPLTSMETVQGVVLVDPDGLVMESTFPPDTDPELLASVYAILDLNIRGQLGKLGESANQVFFSTGDKLILIQKIEDVILVLYTRKSDLAELQSRLLSTGTKVIEFLNLSSAV